MLIPIFGRYCRVWLSFAGAASCKPNWALCNWASDWPALPQKQWYPTAELLIGQHGPSSWAPGPKKRRVATEINGKLYHAPLELAKFWIPFCCNLNALSIRWMNQHLKNYRSKSKSRNRAGIARAVAKGLQVGETSCIYATLNVDIFMPHFFKFFYRQRGFNKLAKMTFRITFKPTSMLGNTNNLS